VNSNCFMFLFQTCNSFQSMNKEQQIEVKYSNRNFSCIHTVMCVEDPQNHRFWLIDLYHAFINKHWGQVESLIVMEWVKQRASAGRTFIKQTKTTEITNQHCKHTTKQGRYEQQEERNNQFSGNDYWPESTCTAHYKPD